MARNLSYAQLAERSVIKKYRKDLWNKFVMGLKDYSLIEENDKIALALSGGKSSLVMAICMKHLQHYSAVKFYIEYIFTDTGYSEEEKSKILDTFAKLEIPVKTVSKNIVEKALTAENVISKYEKLRLIVMLDQAQELGCNKLALADNFDDVIEYNFSSMVYDAKVETPMPKITYDENKNVKVIRPMYMVKEEFLDDFVRYNSLELTQGIFCDTVFSDNQQIKHYLERKKNTKELMTRFRHTNSNIENNIFKSVYNVNLRTIIAYSQNGERHEFLDRYDSFTNKI